MSRKPRVSGDIGRSDFDEVGTTTPFTTHTHTHRLQLKSGRESSGPEAEERPVSCLPRCVLVFLGTVVVSEVTVPENPSSEEEYIISIGVFCVVYCIVCVCIWTAFM